MIAGDIIKHKKFLDVCCIINNVYTNDLSIDWINLGFVESFKIGKVQIIQIKDINDWEICLTPNDKCLRYAQWGKI